MSVNAAKTSVASRLKAVDQYWFGGGSPVTLGLFRIVMCGLCFVNLLFLMFDWDAWFSEKGYVPSFLGQMWLGNNLKPFPTLNFEVPRLDLLHGITDPRITLPFFVITMLCAILGSIGLATKWVLPALAVGIVSLHHRNIAILHGGDTILRVCILYLAVSPCGKACSADRLVGRWRGTAPIDPPVISLWPQRLITFQVALIYFTSVWIKYYGVHWKDGTATWYTARLAEFYRFPVPSFVNDLPMVRLTTYGTLFVEFSMATLVFFRPLRTPVLILGAMMHQYIDYSMNIPLFSFLMISTYICFYDGEEISAFAHRLALLLKRFRVTIILPTDYELRPEISRILPSLNPLQLLEVASSPVSDRWTATENGRAVPPRASILWRSPLLFLLGLGTNRSVVRIEEKLSAETEKGSRITSIR